MALDYRFVDFLTNAGFFDAAFRGALQLYQPIEAGTHTFKVFLSSTVDTITSVFVNETTFDFAEGSHYSIIHSGYMRSGSTPAATVTIVEDDPPTPAAGRVALRAVNLAGDLGAVDVFVGTTSTAGQPPAAAPTWTNVAFGTFTPYVELDTAGLRVAATGTAS